MNDTTKIFGNNDASKQEHMCDTSCIERNISAVALAELLASGRDNREIAEIMQFLQTVASLLKTYMK